MSKPFVRQYVLTKVFTEAAGQRVWEIILAIIDKMFADRGNQVTVRCDAMRALRAMRCVLRVRWRRRRWMCERASDRSR